MNILLVNDDGVYASGINVLKLALKKAGHKVVIVAPLSERSATGHTITLDNPIRLIEIEDDVYGLSGFPADCTLMGLVLVAKKLDIKFDLVISGINRGANLGQDIFYSGTVAAAREASFRGIPAMAVSSCMDFHSSDHSEKYYETASNFITDLIQLDVHLCIPECAVLNVNVPWCETSNIKGIKKTHIGFRYYSEDILERTDFRGRDYFWIGGVYKGFRKEADSDCQAIEDLMISVSLLKVSDFSSDLVMKENSVEHEKLDNLLQRLSANRVRN